MVPKNKIVSLCYMIPIVLYTTSDYLIFNEESTFIWFYSLEHFPNTYCLFIWIFFLVVWIYIIR